jgi:tetratricopeptide (TPR) repeat protein
MKATEGFRRSRHAAQKALEFEPQNGLAYSRLGIIAMWSDNDLDAAAKHFEKGLELDPNDATLLMNTGQFLLLIGRMDEEMAVLGRALTLDPVNVNLLQNVGICEINNGQIDQGIAKLRTGLDLNPGLAVMHYAIGIGYVLKGDADTALHEMQLEQEDFRRCGLPIVYHALGRKADSDAALNELITKDADLAAYNIAQCYAFRGEKDHAFEWLDRAWTAQDPGLNGLLYDDLLDGLHSDPRWAAFLTRIGRAPERLEKIEFRVPLPPGTGKATS